MSECFGSVFFSSDVTVLSPKDNGAMTLKPKTYIVAKICSKLLIKVTYKRREQVRRIWKCLDVVRLSSRIVECVQTCLDSRSRAETNLSA